MRRYLNLLTEGSGLGNPESVLKVGPLTFDQANGIGNVPDNQNVTYLGFACFMQPQMFAKIVTARDFGRSNVKGIQQALSQGEPLASPFLDVEFDKNDPTVVPRIMQHEGRTRCQAVKKLYGDVPILVHCFVRGGLRARHLTLEHIAHFRREVCPQGTQAPLVGPHCAQQVWHLTGWQDIP